MYERPKFAPELVLDEGDLRIHSSAAYHEAQEFHAAGGGDRDSDRDEACRDVVSRVTGDDHHLGGVIHILEEGEEGIDQVALGAGRDGGGVQG